jgi:hypothetical protein
MIKAPNPELDMSRGLFLEFQGKRVYETGSDRHAEGNRLVSEAIVRFKDGYIHGGTDAEGALQPAIECSNAHTEWWENGFLHREGGPAIISDFGDWEEYWNHGNLVMIRCLEEGVIEPERGDGRES